MVNLSTHNRSLKVQFLLRLYYIKNLINYFYSKVWKGFLI